MNASHFLLVLLLCLLCALPGNAQSRSSVSGEGQQTRMLTSPALQLTMKIVGQIYCRGDSDLDGLRLNVLFSYSNTGSQPLLLYKGSNLASRIMVSRTLEDAAAKRFELNSSVTHVTASGSKCFKGSVPTKCFVILPPGRSYDVKGIVGVFAFRDDSRPVQGGIVSGNHILEVEVPTWPASNELARKLSGLWEQRMDLWSRPITTEPIAFTVEKQRRIAACH